MKDEMEGDGRTDGRKSERSKCPDLPDSCWSRSEVEERKEGQQGTGIIEGRGEGKKNREERGKNKKGEQRRRKRRERNEEKIVRNKRR